MEQDLSPLPESKDDQRIDPETGLPLPDPFSDYIPCPHCGEPEVEVWCYQAGGNCHNCGQWVPYQRPSFCGVAPTCKRATDPTA